MPRASATISLILLSLFGLTCQSSSDPATPRPPISTPTPRPLTLTWSWQPVAAGLDVSYLDGYLPSSPDLLEGLTLRINPEHWDMRVLDLRPLGEKGLTTSEIVTRLGATAAINGGFFDEKWQPLGILITGGKVVIKKRPVDWGILFNRGQRWSIVHTRDWTGEDGVSEALQVGPRLVVGGEVLKLKPQISQRSAIGITAGGQILLLATRSLVQASDLAEVIKRLGAVDALNLDGGPSTQLSLRAGEISRDISGGYPVPTALAVFPHTPPPTPGP